MLKVIVIILAVLLCLFLLSLVIYFFNLDMKFAAAMTPVMNKYYDHRKKKEAEKKARTESKDEAEDNRE